MIAFVQNIQNVSFVEAAKILAERFGVRVEPELERPTPAPVDRGVERRKRVLTSLLEQESVWWQRRTLHALRERADIVSGIAAMAWGIGADYEPCARRAQLWRTIVMRFEGLNSDQVLKLWMRRRTRMVEEYRADAKCNRSVIEIIIGAM